MSIVDRRDEMGLVELVEELELSRPEKVAEFERRHRDAMEAVTEDGVQSADDVDDDELSDALSELRDDLTSLLRV